MSGEEKILAAIENMQKDINELKTGQAAMQKELHDFKVETNEKFEQIDKRFERIDKRFEKLEDSMNEGFISLQYELYETMDREFTKVNQRLDDIILAGTNYMFKTDNEIMKIKRKIGIN